MKKKNFFLLGLLLVNTLTGCDIIVVKAKKEAKARKEFSDSIMKEFEKVNAQIDSANVTIEELYKKAPISR